MAKALLADISSSLDSERSQSQKAINNYRKLITSELPELLHKDFGIPLHQLPSNLYFKAVCDICEDTR
jgi:hypothetical protein